MNVKRIAIGDLHRDPRNVRTHDPRNLDAIAASLEQFGQQKPLVVDATGQVVAGNGTLAAAAQLGWVEVEVVETELVGEAARAFAIADNRTAELAGWDEQALYEAVSAMESQANLDALGFTPGEMEAIAERLTGGARKPVVDPEPQVERAEELRQEWGVEVGQVWTLGAHRVICGDCTDTAVVERVLGGEKPAAVVTDPPYGVGVNYATFDDSLENVQALIAQFMPLIRTMEPIALTPGIPAMWLYPKPTWLLAWIHPAASGSGPWGFAGLNPIVVYGQDPYLQHGLGRRQDHIVCSTDRGDVEGHPVIKPLKVWAWLVERLTVEPGALVYDPFLGSGTTLIACEQLGRRCYGCEIDPGYVAVTLQRYVDAGGQQPVRLEA